MVRKCGSVAFHLWSEEVASLTYMRELFDNDGKENLHNCQWKTMFCACNFHLWEFRDFAYVFVLSNDVKRDDKCSILSPSLKRSFQFNSRIVVTQCASVMTSNNWEMIAETLSYIFGTPSRSWNEAMQTQSLHFSAHVPLLINQRVTFGIQTTPILLGTFTFLLRRH